MSDLDLFGRPADKPRLPTATTAQLLVLAEVDYLERLDPINGAPQCGFKAVTIARLLDRGWLTRVDNGDPDTDGGRLRLYLTDDGRQQLAASDAWDVYHGGVTASEFTRSRFERQAS